MSDAMDTAKDKICSVGKVVEMNTLFYFFVMYNKTI